MPPDPETAHREPEQCRWDQAVPETPDRILRLDAVLDRTGLSRSTLYRMISDGTFPRQVRISARCAGWRESTVNDWMRNPACFSTTKTSS